MTIPRLLGMRKYWETWPPTHISVARLCMAYLETQPAEQAQPWDPNEHDDLLSMVMG